MDRITAQRLRKAKGSLHLTSKIHKKYDFHWDVVDLIIGGSSLVDHQNGLAGFPMKNAEDADRFIRSYGYDLEDPIEKAEAFGNFHEAINFVRKFFLKPDSPEGLDLEIPRKILELTDVRDLLLMASMHYPGQTSDTQGILLSKFACGVLKVVHAIAHIDKDIRSTYFGDIQKQILDRFYRYLHRDEKEQLYLGEKVDDPLRVDLITFESKPKKSRESILLKLLHKPESVADDIFDQVGVRFVTQNRVDALRVVKFLKDSLIVMPANIKPSRSRNTLINVTQFREQLGQLLERIDLGELNEEDFEKRVLELVPEFALPSDNPHSSEHYRSIQFTARQLIKLRNPMFENVKTLKKLAKKKTGDSELLHAIESIDLQYHRREFRFFYPFEVQVVDQESADENEIGKSAHSEYKKAQIQTALHRVFGSLMDAVRK